MKYNSTRGSVKGPSFQDSVCSGFASDGGMLLPERYPAVSKDELKVWAKTPDFKTLVERIVSLYVEDEIPKDHLKELIDKAYSRFPGQELLPLNHLSHGRLVIAEMFHGPTWSFKDYAMVLVGQFLEYFLSKSQKHLIILIATSGDTGSAAISAVRGLKLVDIIVTLPRGRCSKLQELQMTTAIDDNVHIYRADGCSDVIDEALNNIYGDDDFVKQYNIASMNSINWARIMIQIVHYFYIYLQTEPACEKEVEIVIPTGACGNVTAGCIARRMGLPIKLVCAVGENDIVDRLLKTGQLTVKPYISTIAPAIDIQMPYNLERIWSIVTREDSSLVKQIMADLNHNSDITIPETLLCQMKDYISSFSANETLLKQAIKRCYEEDGYIVCPHTAVAVAYHYHEIKKDNNKNARVIVATAAPKKFPEALEKSGVPFKVPGDVKELYSKPTKYTDLETHTDWSQEIRLQIIEIDNKRQKLPC